MTNDRLKTAVLVTLFALSVLLAQRLLVDIPFNIMPSFGQLNDTPKQEYDYFLSDIISPERFLVTYGINNHRILYGNNTHNLWTDSKVVLKKIFNKENSDIELIEKKEYIQYKNKRSIVLQFKEQIPSQVISKMLGIYTPSSIHNQIGYVEDIYIRLGSKGLFIFTDGEKYLKVENPEISIESIAKTIKDIENNSEEEYVTYYPGRTMFGAQEDVYAPAPNSMVNTLPDVYAKSGVIGKKDKEMESMIENFFDKDIDYIRKVVENNGSVIYMYDPQGLVISPNGVLEYFNEIEEPVLERDLYESLTTAVDFIKENNRWPTGAYLTDIEKIESKGNKGYRFNITYRVNNKPVVLNKNSMENLKGLKAPIEIEVYNEYVKNYKEYLRDEDIGIYRSSIYKTQKAKVPEDVIRENIDLIKYIYAKETGVTEKEVEILEILSSIKKISLAYYDPCERTKGQIMPGVWIIKIGETEYIFDIQTGDVVNKENLM
ncbi:MAG: hypothetical protein FH753_06745 [Firmicutes bacterium]|nr:hypothetical protein [Bacillota bacterium]